MKSAHRLEQLGDDDIVAAIREAEMKTSGEIRVFISQKRVSDPVAAAGRHFVSLGMNKTRERNGVLIFVAPLSKRFAVLGDTGIHARCGPGFWEEMVGEMTAHFRQGEFTRGIIGGIKKAAGFLALHFPRRPDDKNELPDEVVRD
jgi:uncharacterized membrane protein